jgi:hypothetical protein
MMWSMLRAAVLVATAACAVLGLSACQSDSDEAPVKVAATLSDLREIEQLRTKFNEDEGVPRLIVILSPT